MNPYKKIGSRCLIIVGIWIFFNLFVHQPAMAEGNVWDALHQDGQQMPQQEETGAGLETDVQEELFSTDEGPNMFMLILQIIFYLVLILAMIYGLIKFLAIRQKKMGHHQLFQTLGGISLGTNKSLQVVKVGGRFYLLGVAEQITLIKEISDPLEIEALERDLDEQESIISKSFKSMLLSKLESEQHKDVKQPVEQHLKDSLATIKQQRAMLAEEWLKQNKEGNQRD